MNVRLSRAAVSADGGVGTEAAAERRFQARLPLPADVEHLFGVGADQAVGGPVGEFQRGPRLAVGVGGGRLRDGLAERRGGLADFLLQLGGDLQAAHLPVGRLAAELVDLAAGQLDEKLVGVRPFHQGGRGAHEKAGAGDRPGGDEVAAFVHAAGDGHLRGREAEVGRPGHVVRAAGHAGVFQFPRGLGRHPARKCKPHRAHERMVRSARDRARGLGPSPDGR